MRHLINLKRLAVIPGRMFALFLVLLLGIQIGMQASVGGKIGVTGKATSRGTEPQGGSPGGSDGQVQYRLNSTTFGGSSGITLTSTQATLVNPILGNQSAAPANALGKLYVDTDDSKPYFNDGTQWKEMVLAGTVMGIASGGTGQTTSTAAFNALAPCAAKGSIIVHNGTNWVCLPVGATNGHVLKVNSATTTGVEWAAP